MLLIARLTAGSDRRGTHWQREPNGPPMPLHVLPEGQSVFVMQPHLPSRVKQTEPYALAVQSVLDAQRRQSPWVVSHAGAPVWVQSAFEVHALMH